MSSAVERQAIVPYSAAAMFELVANVEAYPEFLPWCTSARVRHRGDGSVEATLEAVKGPLRIAFTTRNIVHEPERLDMHLVEGPFSHLEGRWEFTDLDEDRSRIRLHMSFEFSRHLIAAAIAPIFEDIAGTMVEAFRRRADRVYGRA
jgi:ribosome-associated toxin RatA of RatAB toxin-antitoxin module